MKNSRSIVNAAFMLTATLSLLPSARGAEDFAARAAMMRTELREKILPYWFDTAQDAKQGGYLLADSLEGRGTATEKQIVSQARMIWGFAEAHRRGFSDGRRNYLAAARQGYRFLQDHFYDPENGGYYWSTDLAGKPTVDRKILYGEAFVLYALVEYSRASGDAEALRHATNLFQTLQRQAHDRQNPGWIEHFRRDWTPILSSGAEVEIPGLKSANAHLHVMEALAELYDVTHDPAVADALQEAIKINATWFYPKAAEESCLYCEPNGKPATPARTAGLSYGHNIEFAWLMIRAQQVLGRKPDWDHFDSLMRHALRCGTDLQRGGLYSRGFGNAPATDTTKVWWVQSEWMASLSDALHHAPDPAYSDALAKLIQFVWAHQVNAADGIWIDSVSADGTKVVASGKAHNWKANYHDVRAMLKFIDAFEKK